MPNVEKIENILYDALTNTDEFKNAEKINKKLPINTDIFKIKPRPTSRWSWTWPRWKWYGGRKTRKRHKTRRILK